MFKKLTSNDNKDECEDVYSSACFEHDWHKHEDFHEEGQADTRDAHHDEGLSCNRATYDEKIWIVVLTNMEQYWGCFTKRMGE